MVMADRFSLVDPPKGTLPSLFIASSLSFFSKMASSNSSAVDFDANLLELKTDWRSVLLTEVAWSKLSGKLLDAYSGWAVQWSVRGWSLSGAWLDGPSAASGSLLARFRARNASSRRSKSSADGIFVVLTADRKSPLFQRSRCPGNSSWRWETSGHMFSSISSGSPNSWQKLKIVAIGAGTSF